jgi:hypothetical protein
MSSEAMEQELANWPVRAACQAHSVGRQTAVRFGFPRIIGFGRSRPTDRDSTRCCLAGAPRPRSAAAVGLPMGNSSCSCHEALSFSYSGLLPASQLWVLDERRSLFRRAPTEPVQLTSGPIRWNTPIPGKDGTKIFAPWCHPARRTGPL